MHSIRHLDVKTIETAGCGGV